MRVWPNAFRIGDNKDAIKQQFSEAFAAREFQVILAFFFGAFLALMAVAAATHSF